MWHHALPGIHLCRYFYRLFVLREVGPVGLLHLRGGGALTCLFEGDLNTWDFHEVWVFESIYCPVYFAGTPIMHLVFWINSLVLPDTSTLLSLYFGWKVSWSHGSASTVAHRWLQTPSVGSPHTYWCGSIAPSHLVLFSPVLVSFSDLSLFSCVPSCGMTSWQPSFTETCLMRLQWTLDDRH